MIVKTTDSENYTNVLATPARIYSMATNGAGVIVAGSHDGTVKYSLDNGATW